MGNTFNTGRLINGLFTDVNGNVGINSSSPAYRLDIQNAGVNVFGATNTASWTSGFMNHSYFLAPNMTGGGLSIGFGKSGSTYNIAKIVYNHVGNSNSSNYIGLGFWDADNRLIIRADGFIGVGTTSPADIIDVQRNQNGTTNFYFRNTDTTNTNSRAYVNIVSGNVTLQLKAIHGDNVYITPTTAVDQYLGYNNSIRIASDGTLNVGTYHATNKICPGADSNHYLRYNTSLDGLEMSGYSGVMFSTYGGSERMRIRLNGNKTFNGPGGQDQMFSGYARAANGDYLDIDTESGGGNFQGFLIIANSYAYNAGYRSQGTFSAIGRGTTFSLTTIATVNGSTGSSGFSVTCPSAGVIRVTNTGLYGDLIVSWRGFV